MRSIRCASTWIIVRCVSIFVALHATVVIFFPLLFEALSLLCLLLRAVISDTELSGTLHQRMASVQSLSHSTGFC